MMIAVVVTDHMMPIFMMPIFMGLCGSLQSSECEDTDSGRRG
jgi:hypothetical protein